MNGEPGISGFHRGIKDVLAPPRRYPVLQSKKKSLNRLTIEGGNHKLCRYIGTNQ